VSTEIPAVAEPPLAVVLALELAYAKRSYYLSAQE
jgi:hypothetical protein